jgi:hypothetical protein
VERVEVRSAWTIDSVDSLIVVPGRANWNFIGKLARSSERRESSGSDVEEKERSPRCTVLVRQVQSVSDTPELNKPQAHRYSIIDDLQGYKVFVALAATRLRRQQGRNTTERNSCPDYGIGKTEDERRE